MALPNGHLRVFVARTLEDVPPGAHPFASVDGSVPGAAALWDHHRSGELVNLDALPARIDATHLCGVGTTLADTDAAISVALVLLGGPAVLTPADRDLLLAASSWCDHLRPHPEVGGALDARGERVHAFVSAELDAAKDISATFAAVARLIAERLAAGDPLPEAEPARITHAERAQSLDQRGRVQRLGRVALVDLRGEPSVDPLATYALHRCPIAVTLGVHERGGHRYTIGVNPFVSDHPTDLRPALERLSAEEHRHGPPCLVPTPNAQGSWGGRATVFGSPWTYGSRLAPDEVVRIVDAAIFGDSR